LDAWVAKGAQIVKGDVSAPDTLPAALKGVDLVISTLSGEGLFGGSGEIELARAAKAAGVKRFVPSSFGIDLFDFSVGQYPTVDAKVKTLDELKKLGLDFVVVTTNTWTDFALGFNFLGWNIIQGSEALIPNDGNEYVLFLRFDAFFADILLTKSVFCSYASFTTLHDVPRLAIPAIADPSLKNAHVKVAGDNLTWNQVADLAEKTLGKKITRNYFDTKKIDEVVAGISNPMGKFGFWIAKQYQTRPSRSDFRADAYNLQHPEKYQNFKPTTVEQWLQQAAKQH
jgi:hypothetical protein